MTNAQIDNNGIPVLIATSNADGSTPVLVKVNATNNGLLVDDGAGGSDLSSDIASRDENYYPILMGVSSDDGVTPTAIYADPATNKLLIKST